MAIEGLIWDEFGRSNEEATAVRKPSGFIMVGGQTVADTVMCSHCGTHFMMVKGSGIRRGFCTNCMGMTCGKAQCGPCYPMQKRIADREKTGK